MSEPIANSAASFAPAEVTVAILAGGLGTRLRPAVADRPKVMAEVGGRPFLMRWLDCLAEQGFRRVVLCTGHRAEQVRAGLGTEHRGLTLAYSVETTPLGTGGALRHALPRLTSEVVLVLNGDSFCQTDLPAFGEAHFRSGTPAGLVLLRLEDTRRFGRVALREDGRVARFEEKNESLTGAGWINAGIYLLRRELLASLPANKPQSLERDALPRWLAQGVFGFPTAGPFIDIGTPESYGQAENFFAGPNRFAGPAVATL